MRRRPCLCWLLLAVPSTSRATAPHHPHDIIDCVAVSPTFDEDGTVFVASDGSINLVLRSTNRGMTWTEVRSGLTGRHVHEMLLARDFAKSGRGYVALGNDGLQWTDDHGGTWRPTPLRRGVELLASTPFGADALPTLYLGSATGLIRTADPGVKDVELAPELFRKHAPVALAVTAGDQGDVVFVASRDGRLHRSRDGGAHWSSAEGSGDVRRIVFSPRFATDRTVWLATFGGGIRVSRDGGETFAACNEGLTDLDVNDVAV